MSNKIKSLVIYQNLPTGGAKELYELNTKYLSKKVSVKVVSDSYLTPKNFIEYMRICIFQLSSIHKDIYEQLPKSNKVLLVYHSWLTKSPHLLRYVPYRKVYICHETMREFYDYKHIESQSIKEKLVNMLRLPIKYIDRKNMRVKNITLIANSYFSKNAIDRVYKVNSIVVHPGIDTKLFNVKAIKKNKHQVISVGSINKLKGFEFLVNVISRVAKINRPKLVLIGNGSDINYVRHLRELSKNLSVELEIIVNISKDELVKKYFESKIFLYAPVSEPFGIVVEEAMAAGLPLMVYKDGGGYIEILSKQNGQIIDNLEIDIWANILESMLNDKKLLEKYSKYNSHYVRVNYDQSNMNYKIWNSLNKL